MAFVSTMRAALQARESVDSVGCKAQRRIAAATVISLHVASARHDRYVRHGDSAENKLLDRELSDACCWSAVKGECWMDRADQLDKEDAPALVFTALSFDNTILGLVVASVAVIPSEPTTRTAYTLLTTHCPRLDVPLANTRGFSTACCSRRR